MVPNTTLVTPSVANPSHATYEVTGWNPSDNTRGSIDILWSCCITMVLCCWVSTFPNVPSPKDRWYHSLIDKFNLACIGLVGPDYLFAVALGQFSSAQRSVKLFRTLPRHPEDEEWTLVHGFFADMGGFILESPDCEPFPVNAEQLHYLVSHGYVDFPRLRKLDIKVMSKTDGLSKLIVLWQVSWFSVSTLLRLKENLPMTTFELTALSFSLTMLITSLCWYAKPTISTPTKIRTKDNMKIEEIRTAARGSTHPGLPWTWYRTPLDFVSPYRRFRCDVHWSYYQEISYMMKLPVLSRQIKARPWDRFPSDAHLVVNRALLFPAFLVGVGFSLSPLAAWNFHFPTEGERLAWRVCSVYHAVFSVVVPLYYIYAALRLHKRASGKANRSEPLPPSSKTQHSGGPIPEETRPVKSPECSDVEAATAPSEQAGGRCKGFLQARINWLRSWRNISSDGDPDMEMSLRLASSAFVGTILYLLCRLFFYVEDWLSIRQQPVDVYVSMNKFIPFMF